MSRMPKKLWNKDPIRLILGAFRIWGLDSVRRHAPTKQAIDEALKGAPLPQLSASLTEMLRDYREGRAEGSGATALEQIQLLRVGSEMEGARAQKFLADICVRPKKDAAA